MLLSDIFEIADGLAPFSISQAFCETYGMYDNSGVLVDCMEEIKGVLFSLDLSGQAIAAAKRAGANCIITHHPAIFAPLKALTAEEGVHVLGCARAGISVISAHLNLDAAEGGIDACLMEGLGGKSALAVMQKAGGGSYGRVYEVEGKPFQDFVAQTKKEFGTERVVVYGERPVKRVASFCGAGLDAEAIEFAANSGADTIVSSDGKHHVIAKAVEYGLNVVLITHYAAENYGFVRFAKKMEKLLKGTPCTVFTDERFR